MSLHRYPCLPASKLQGDRRFRRKALLAATAISIIGCASAQAADGDANEVLLKKLEKMEQRIEMLEAELKQKQASPSEKQAAPSDKSTKSDNNTKSAAAPASPKNANAAGPSDHPQDLKDKPAPNSKPLDAATPAPGKPVRRVAPAPAPGAGLTRGVFRRIQ